MEPTNRVPKKASGNGGETPLLSKPSLFGFFSGSGYPPIKGPFLNRWISTQEA